MAISVTLTDVKQANGRIYIQFGKRLYEFNSLVDLQRWVQSVLSRDVADALFVAAVIERAPTLNAAVVNAIKGHSLNIDLSVNNWGTVS